MDITDSQLIDVFDASQIGEARRAVVAVAAQHGFAQKDLDRLALVATELGTNLIKHTPAGGNFIVQGLTHGDNLGLELFALDKGRGMDVEKCVADGYSTVGTLGTGLGAVKRLSDSFDALSVEGRGTIIHTRLWTAKTDLVEPNLGGITVPIKGEVLSGDKWVACKSDNQIYCVMVDGLGHGFEAAEASKLAVQRFKENLRLPPQEILKLMHTSLRGTRGAVAAVARIDLKNGQLTYSGLGNIVGVLFDADSRKHLVSLNGTLGYEAHKILEFTFPWKEDSRLLMHSDGLPTRASEELDALGKPSASLTSAFLFLHRTKGTDDSSVMVVNN